MRNFKTIIKSLLGAILILLVIALCFLIWVVLTCTIGYIVSLFINPNILVVNQSTAVQYSIIGAFTIVILILASLLLAAGYAIVDNMIDW